MFQQCGGVQCGGPAGAGLGGGHGGVALRQDGQASGARPGVGGAVGGEGGGGAQVERLLLLKLQKENSEYKTSLLAGFESMFRKVFFKV